MLLAGALANEVAQPLLEPAAPAAAAVVPFCVLCALSETQRLTKHAWTLVCSSTLARLIDTPLQRAAAEDSSAALDSRCFGQGHALNGMQQAIDPCQTWLCA